MDDDEKVTGRAEPHAGFEAGAGARYGRSPDLIMIVGPEGVIQDVQWLSASVACPEAEALVGTSFFHYVHEDNLLSLFRVVVDLVVGDVPTAALHLHLQLKKGHWQEFEGSAVTVVLPEMEHSLLSDHLAKTQILYQLHLVTGKHPHPEATLWTTSAFARRWAEYVGGVSR